MRQSIINPNKSAYEQVHGKFNFNITPLAPLGSKTTVHRKPNQRTSWEIHGATGYYVGPAMSHYRSLTFYLPRSGGECISDTAAIYSTMTTVPVWTAEDALIQTVLRLTQTIRASPISDPFNALLEAQKSTLKKISEIFQQFGTTPVAPTQKITAPLGISTEMPHHTDSHQADYQPPRVKNNPSNTIRTASDQRM